MLKKFLKKGKPMHYTNFVDNKFIKMDSKTKQIKDPALDTTIAHVHLSTQEHV